MPGPGAVRALARRIGFWGLLPWLIPQALWVRRNAPRFAAADGARVGGLGAGPHLRLLTIGDSVVAGAGIERLEDALPGQLARALSEYGRTVIWTTLGRIGARAASVRQRLVPKLPGEPFDAIVLSVGVNDVTGVRLTRQWRRDLRNLLRSLRDHSPRALIVVSGLPPLGGFPLLPRPLRFAIGLRARSFDPIARAVTEDERGAVFVPTDFDPAPAKFAPDGFHPSAESCKVWGTRLAEIIAQHLEL